jgi:mannosyltransferase
VFRLRAYGGVLFAAATSALFSAYHISSRAIWNDEGVSIGMATMPISAWRVAVRHEPNMALYYAVLRVWMVLGHSEAAIRSLSAVAAVATVILLFVLLHRLFGGREALVGSMLLATNSYFIRFAQEARSYALLTMVVVGAMIAFIHWATKPSRGAMVLFVLLSATAFYLHVLSVLVFAAAIIAALVSPVRGGVKYAVVLYGILTLPMWKLLLHAQEYISWIPAPKWRSLITSAEVLCGDAGYPVAAAYGCLLAGLAVLVLQRMRQRAEVWPWLLLLLWSVLPAAALIGMAAFRHPLFITRFVVMSLPALAASGAVALCRLPRRIGSIAATALICASLVAVLKSTRISIGDYDDMRSVVEFMNAHAHMTDSVVVYWPQSAFAFQYYANRSSLGLLPVAFPRMQSPETVTILQDDAMDRGVLNKSTRVWFIVDTAPLRAGEPAAQRLTNHIRQSFPFIADRRDFCGFTVMLYDRVSPADTNPSPVLLTGPSGASHSALR